MKLVIAEKPSVAKSIADVIGANTKKDGFFEGEEYIVSWCLGHLVELCEPDAYNDIYKSWRIEDLPILPGVFKTSVVTSTSNQYKILKDLITSDRISELICATDAGREGELIFRLVYNQIKSNKPFKRLWISSMEDIAIKEGFNNLKQGKDFDNLYKSAFARAKADWLVGMNLTRLYSVLYGQNFSVGRVQTPTLAMIVNRDRDINNFQKEKYYTLSIISDEFTLSTGRIDDLATADQLKNLIEDEIEITNVIQKENITSPDLPFDLTTLQRECNKYFGFSAKETLDYAQDLYEKKMITYPRTDSRYLTEDMIDSTINSILSEKDFDAERIKVVFNSKKVTDHHAIIPTASSLQKGLSELSENAAKTYKLILNKLYASFGYPLIENTTKIIAEYDGFEFTSSGTVIENEGFTKYLKEYRSKKSEDIILPNINVGDRIQIKDKELKEKYTQPPKHYTENTLLKSMEVAGSEAIEKGIEVERKGLGTPATRAGIIERLIGVGYVIREKKNLIASDKGKALIDIVSEAVKNPETTAYWENQLAKISTGNFKDDVFIDNICNEIKNVCQNTNVIEKYKKESQNMIGKCPICGNDVLIGKKAYFCANKECDFRIYKEICKAQIDVNLAKELLTNNISSKFLSMKSKAGKSFSAKLKLTDGKIEFEFKGVKK
ncbi:DNA topoisomerase 3 [Peptoniphilus sp. GNH]|nr:DNA topoisomerase 3 [Peptoniphilus sp. GNH]